MDLLLFTGNGFTRWLEANMLACPSKKYLHMECPGCGFQRSCLALIKGDLHSSWQFYPPAVPLLVLLLFTLLHLRYKFNYGATIIKYLQVTTAIMIVVFYIYKILNHKIIA